MFLFCFVLPEPIICSFPFVCCFVLVLLCSSPLSVFGLRTEHNGFIQLHWKYYDGRGEKKAYFSTHVSICICVCVRALCIIKHRIYRRLWAHICGFVHLFSNSSISCPFASVSSFCSIRSFIHSSHFIFGSFSFSLTPRPYLARVQTREKKIFNYWNCILSGQR